MLIHQLGEQIMSPTSKYIRIINCSVVSLKVATVQVMPSSPLGPETYNNRVMLNRDLGRGEVYYLIAYSDDSSVISDCYHAIVTDGDKFAYTNAGIAMAAIDNVADSDAEFEDYMGKYMETVTDWRIVGELPEVIPSGRMVQSVIENYLKGSKL